MLEICEASCGFERGKLKAPFGFKGKYITDYWHSSVRLEDDKGNVGCAPGMQSVVWSDANILEKLGQSGGNAAMYMITCHAVEMVKGKRFHNPVEMISEIFDALYERATKITGLPDLRKTFVLNALVPVDLAAWQLYAKQIGPADFDSFIPEKYKRTLSMRNKNLACIPLITYALTKKDILELVRKGAFLLKIKLGCDPNMDGDLDKMLQWDMQRISQIHEIVKDIETPYTDCGRPVYYFDANGRYDSRERLEKLITHMKEIGALERTVILEEPFPEKSGIDVHGIPVCIAADESAHGVEETKEMISLGYRAIALKPIAKTLSVSLEMAHYAYNAGVFCFCADLTVPPLLVDWNKNVAARLKPIPGIKMSVLEANGKQNYSNWDELKLYHPMAYETWIDDNNSIYTLNDTFYQTSGGILLDSSHYLAVSRDN